MKAKHHPPDPSPAVETNRPEQKRTSGCFWIAGWLGALMITSLALIKILGAPGPDGPFGGIFWLMLQGTCLLVCLTFAITSAFDPSLSRTQRQHIWLLTLYPVLVFIILIATGD